MLTSVAKSLKLPLNASCTKARCNDDAIHFPKQLCHVVRCDPLAMDGDEVELAPVICRSLEEGFIYGFVGILELNILAHKSDVYCFGSFIA